MLVGRGLERLDRSRSHHILSQEEVRSLFNVRIICQHCLKNLTQGDRLLFWLNLIPTPPALHFRPKSFGLFYNLWWFQVAGGKTTSWPELEITGTIKNLSPALWRLQHLTALYLNDNSLFRIPPSISLLQVRRSKTLKYNLLNLPPSESQAAGLVQQQTSLSTCRNRRPSQVP